MADDQMVTTPVLKLRVGDTVRVRGYEHEGERQVKVLYDQVRVPGGVILDRNIDDFFVSWNEDELELVRRGTP